MRVTSKGIPKNWTSNPESINIISMIIKDIYNNRKLKSEIDYYLNDGSKINSIKILRWIKKRKPDIIFCIGWSQLLKKKLLNIAPKGVIGYHPSDLPKNRGRHPIIWSLALGLKNIGSSFFYMDSKADSGRIISKKMIKIKKDSNSYSVYKDLIKIGKKQIREIISKIKDNKLYSSLQKNSESNYWRKRSDIDGKIDWRMSADNINNLVKALTKPYPGAYFFLKEKKITVWKSKVINLNARNLEPGKIVRFNKDLIIKCGNKALKIITVYPRINLKKIKYL